jgi:PAS domain S-box-containing protein
LSILIYLLTQPGRVLWATAVSLASADPGGALSAGPAAGGWGRAAVWAVVLAAVPAAGLAVRAWYRRRSRFRLLRRQVRGLARDPVPGHRLDVGGSGEAGRLAREMNLLLDRLEEDRCGLERRVAKTSDQLQSMGAELRANIEELEDHQAYLGRILDTILTGVLVIDEGDHTIVDVNPAAAEMIGLPRQEIMGRVCHNFVCPAEAGRCPVTDLGREIDSSRRVLLSADGQSIPILKTVSRVAFGDRNYLIEGFVDFRDQARVEENLRRARHLAEDASRAKSEFLAVMSHELRTPLAGVLGMFQLLESTPLTEEQFQYVLTGRESGRSLLALLDDLLHLSRLEAGQVSSEAAWFETEDLLDPIRGAVDEAAARKGLFLDVRVGHAVPGRLLGDCPRLRHILLNVAGNAVKFTEQGGVRVEVDLAPRLGRPDQGVLVVSVADTGPGIAPHEVPRLFTPFTQADAGLARRHQGAGLGLALVGRLTALLSGSIWVDSEPGQGCSFSMGFPVGLDTGAQAGTAGRAGREGDTGLDGVRILVVEDNRINRLAVVKLLQKQGCRVREAADGIEGLELLSREKFDAVLMDIQMPGISGVEALKRLRSGAQPGADPATPVVALTGQNLPGDREALLAEGMDGYVAKPFENAELIGALLEVIEAGRHRLPPAG